MSHDAAFRPTPAPLYRQVEEHLARQIAAGVYQPGTLLPSDAQLCAAYGVSRITVRAALDRLVSANMVRRQQGVGTFVNRPEQGIKSARLLGYIDDIHPHLNLTVLERGARRLPDSLVKDLDVEPGTMWDCVVGTNRIGGEPLSFFEFFYPNDIAVLIHDEDFLGKVPMVRLVEMRTGRRFDHAIQRIAAFNASDRVAKHLGLRRGKAVIGMERIYFATDRTVLEAEVAFYHPERYQVEIRLVPYAGVAAGMSRKTQDA